MRAKKVQGFSLDDFDTLRDTAARHQKLSTLNAEIGSLKTVTLTLPLCNGQRVDVLCPPRTIKTLVQQALAQAEKELAKFGVRCAK